MLALLVYVVILCAWALFWTASTPTSIWALQDSAELRQWVLRLAFASLVQVIRFVPVGFLAWLVIGSQRRELVERTWAARAGRAIIRLLGALAVSCAFAAFVQSVQLGRVAPLAYLLLPVAGSALGIWAGWAWQRGWQSRLWFAGQLVALNIAGGIAAAALVWSALETAPLAFEPEEITSEHKRRLIDEIRVSEVPGTDTRQLRLSEEEINFLFSWGLSLGSPQRKARVLFDEHQMMAEASLLLPLGKTSRYVNAQFAGWAEVGGGQVQVRVDRAKVGRLRLPPAMVNLIVPLLLSALCDDPDAGPAIASIEELRSTGEELRVTAKKGIFTSRVLPSLAMRLGAKPDVRAATEAQIAHLASACSRFPAGDAAFAAYLQTAFQFARQRTADGGDPVMENRAAIYGLGILLGHPRIEKLVGPVTDVEVRNRLRRDRKSVTVRGRGDWVQHFWVSAALTLLSSEPASNAAGLLKEELDAGQGSGFSFSDLLADRAGTLFASAATRDEQAAEQMQRWMTEAFDLDEVFPPAADLPENIADQQLRENYGGVGGQGYRAMVAEIERRLAGCRILQAAT